MKRERAGGLLGSELRPEELARLQAWVGSSGLTQQQIADAIDTAPSVISKGLSGEIPISMARLRLVCELLGRQFHELFAPGPTVLQEQPDLTPAQIALEMERLSKMLLRVTRKEAKQPTRARQAVGMLKQSEAQAIAASATHPASDFAETVDAADERQTVSAGRPPRKTRK